MSRSQQNADYLSASNYGVKNKIINGNFDVWQRGTSISVTASATYTADRYVAYYDGTGATRTVSREAFTVGQTDVPYEPRYFLRYAQTVAGSGATYTHLANRIEGVRTFAGQTVTLSFYAKFASTTSIDVKANQIFGSGGSPSTNVVTNFGFNFSVGTAWTKYTFTLTLPSIAGKTLGTNNDDIFDIFFTLPINTTFTFDIAQIQLEAGSIATPFEQRPFGTELALCQRYYEKSYNQVETPGTISSGGCAAYVAANSTNGEHSMVCFRVSKRTTPTITYYSTVTGTPGKVRNATTNADISSSYSNIVGESSYAGFGVATTTGNLYLWHWTASAEL